MTNHWIDVKNSDCILIIGSNAAENHPVFFRWALKAREKGGKIIHVDPRFTRTSQLSDIYARIRPGTDIAFIGGIINYVLHKRLYNEWYVREYTNATFLVRSSFKTATDLNGVFPGLQGNRYDRRLWGYQVDARGEPLKDVTMEDASCVLQLLKKHYLRYSAEKVCRITGCDPATYDEVSRLVASTGNPDRAGVVVYAMGATQHTYGTQNVRAYSILQLLLGNIGVAGGGINALRGESNVQGATDFALLSDSLPGYHPAPVAPLKTLDEYCKRHVPSSADPKSVNWQQHRRAYVVSLLKARYGTYATPQTDFAYHLLPKLDEGKDYSFPQVIQKMTQQGIEGLFLWGMNPVVSAANARVVREALSKVKWMVAVDLWETETAAFWQAPGTDSRSVATEVFLLPAAASFEKEGSVTNSARLAQWRYKAVEPAGKAKPDLDIVTLLYEGLAEAYRREGGALPEAVTRLTWDYSGPKQEGISRPDPHRVAREYNGVAVADLVDSTGTLTAKAGSQLSSFAQLRGDGTTACGCWLYCGSYTEKGNMMARGSASDPTGMGLFPEWGWAWPLNRRILYNRASVDAAGKPRNPRRPVIWWDGAAWQGDVPDGGQPPGTVFPFIMTREGIGRLYAPDLNDGPLPEHYEPVESPVKNGLSKRQINPIMRSWGEKDSALNRVAVYGSAASRRYPYIATTYRLTEHWQTGQMTRWLPWLAEAMPEAFIELSRELAVEKGIRNGDKVRVASVRAPEGVVVRAIVTKRLKPMVSEGLREHLVGLPWHWGYKGLATGPITNELTPCVGDANTGIPEYKAFLVDIEKVV